MADINLQKLMDSIDRSALIESVIEMVNISSPTGSEEAMGQYMERKYRALGLEVIRQEVEPGRPNVFGILRGAGGGPVLQFDGHLDVSFTGTEDFMQGGQSTPTARLETIQGEDWILGAGSYNMKAAHGAYLAAVSAIIESGIKLKGDILLSATSGEIEASQVDDFSGSYYRGNGAGAAYAASHGIVPDFAILGEPTELNLMIGHFGSFWTKISITGGTVIHTAYTRDVNNVIENIPTVLSRLTEFKQEFAERTKFKNYRGLVNIGAVSGGRPWKASRSPDTVSFYLDIRYPPGLLPMHVRAMVDEVIVDLNEALPDFTVTQTPYCTNPPTEIEESDYIAQSIRRHHEGVFGKLPESIYQLWYSNAPPLNSMGAKAVNYGSAGSRRIEGLTLSDKDREYVHVGDLVDISKVYAAVAVDICSKDRSEVRPDLVAG
jgi:acetylornithine deacetylase/succinyl-diaminopimelate desuccinylase-like protein